MRKLVTILSALAVAIGIGAWWMSRGPDASDFAHLREPRLSRLPDQRVLVVEAAGDPNEVAGAAFKQLFSTYYGLEGVSRAARPPAPRARWPRADSTPKAEWVGRYALPVPETVKTPVIASTSGARASVSIWAYGDVAEVLHVGSYDTEAPDIERLIGFITASGYRVVGEHEEEYVRGPGRIFAGDPSGYLTIIRLRVERAAPPSGE
ncbi:MAG: hypothetical protein U0Q12_24085 [Vicinamibacterales bacterium]